MTRCIFSSFVILAPPGSLAYGLHQVISFFRHRCGLPNGSFSSFRSVHALSTCRTFLGNVLQIRLPYHEFPNAFFLISHPYRCPDFLLSNKVVNGKSLGVTSCRSYVSPGSLTRLRITWENLPPSQSVPPMSEGEDLITCHSTRKIQEGANFSPQAFAKTLSHGLI